MPKKNLHKKPTSEELDEKINQSLSELESEAPKEIPEEPSEPETKKEAPPKKEPEEPPKKTKEPDYKKRYEGSTREGQIQYSKSKKLTEAIEKAMQVSEPSEEELTNLYPDWDTMSDFERTIAKDGVMNKKTLESLREATKDFKDMDVWNKTVDKFMADPETLIEYSGLDGKEEEFKIFATKDTRRGADFADLVSAFLYKEGSKPKSKKSSMFEVGTAGLNEKPKSGGGDTITIEESRRLRVVDYKKYLEYVRAGKIDSSEI